MTTTTTFGTWNNHGDRMGLTVAQTITEAFGSEGPEGFDTDAIESDYREAINAALPAGVSLAGDEFYGPAYPAEQDFDGFDTDEHGDLDVKAIIEGIDLWAIIAKHDNA